MSTVTPPMIALADHPRAGGAIRRAKAWGGLLGLALTALGGYLHGSTSFDTGLHALAGGVVGYLLTWAAAIAVWRQIVVSETRVAVRRAVEARRRAAAAAEQER
jgi:hypothetical protein